MSDELILALFTVGVGLLLKEAGDCLKYYLAARHHLKHEEVSKTTEALVREVREQLHDGRNGEAER